MKKLRKLFAVVLAAAVALTPMTTVFAADTVTIVNADKAATLKDLGLYKGTDANDVLAGLDSALTTQDALIFLSRLFGYEDTANALAADQVNLALAKFDDAAQISDYAKNVVAYSAQNDVLKGMTKDGRYFVGSKDTVTAARFATFMLKQMGYTVEDYKESVVQLANVKGSKVAATVNGDLTRGVAVGIIYDALPAEMASGKTVIADIVGDRADLKAMAEEAGLIEAAPVAPDNPVKSNSGGKTHGSVPVIGVESVKALNTKQIEVKFNTEMDETSAQDKDSYQIKEKRATAKTLTDTSCKLSADRKTVVITLDSAIQDCLTNASEVEVIVRKGVKDANANTLRSDKTFEIKVQDGMTPTVTKLETTGERNIRITFSEPVVEGGKDSNALNTKNFKVVSGTYTYYVQKATLNLDVVNLDIETKLIKGPVTVTVNDAGLTDNDVIQDYAGHKVFKEEHTFNYVKDTSGTEVSVKSVSPDQVVLAFSKPVKGTGIKLYHSIKNSADYMSETTQSDYVSELVFTFNKTLPAGNVNLYLVNPDTDARKLVDSYGVKVPDQTLTCEVAGAYDVALNANEGTIASGKNVTGYAYGTAVMLPSAADIIRTGFIFGGWFDNADCTGTAITKISETDSGNKEYYAKWIPCEYAINWQLNGGSVAGSKIMYSYVYGVGAKLPSAADITRTGYTFGGWYERPDFNGGAITEISVTDAGDKSIFAKWTPNEYTMSFETNGGSEVEAITQVYESAVMKPADPTMTGNTFAGWFLDEACKTPYTFDTMPLDGIKLYAGWTVDSYTVTLNANEGVIASDKNVTGYAYGTAVMLPSAADITRTGFTFGGWFDNSACTGTAITKISETDSGNKKYYAKWTINQYTMSFESNGGDEVKAIIQDYGSGVKDPGAPANGPEGMVFDGWCSDKALTTAYTFGAMPADNITLYAKWVKEHIITFRIDAPELVISPTETLTDITDMPVIIAKVKDGANYTFTVEFVEEIPGMTVEARIGELLIPQNDDESFTITNVTEAVEVIIVGRYNESM